MPTNITKYQQQITNNVRMSLNIYGYQPIATNITQEWRFLIATISNDYTQIARTMHK